MFTHLPGSGRAADQAPDQRFTKGQAGDAISLADGRARPPAGHLVFSHPRPRTNTSLP
jgi:hypothetical protein